MISDRLPTKQEKLDYICKELNQLEPMLENSAFNCEYDDEFTTRFVSKPFSGRLEKIDFDDYSRLDSEFSTVWSKYNDLTAVSTNIAFDETNNSLSITFNY